MADRPFRKQNDDPEWDCHKNTIEQLYVIGNRPLEGVDGVMMRMQDVHGFYKTPGQYQIRLKKWGFRKKRHGRDWKIVGRKIAARKEAGRDSAVYLNGELLPKTTVDRQIYRNSYDLAFRPYEQGPMPETPHGFAFLTPVAEDRDSFQTSNLPFIEFQAAINLKRSIPASLDKVEHADDNHSFNRTSRSTNPASSGSRMPSIEAPLPENSQATENYRNAANTYYSTVLPILRSLLPADALEEFSESGSKDMPPLQILQEAYLKLLCFSVANNYAGIADFPLEVIWDYVRDKISVPGLMELALGPTTKALAEKLFNCAIESGDVQAVEYLLQKQYVDANEQVCIIEGARYTPVERSAKLKNIPMTKLLIRYNADVNKTYLKFRHEENGALQCAISRYGEVKHADPALVHMLLDSGAEFDSSTLRGVIGKGDAHVAEMLVRKGTPNDCAAWTKFGILHAAVKHLDSEAATRIVQVMLKAKIDINYSFQGPGEFQDPRKVLDWAALRGYLGLVKILLDDGAFLTEDTLTCAIQSVDMDLVRYVIEKGAKIDSLTTFFETPYSEAIRIRNIELIRILEDQGASLHIEEKFRFRAAACAASEVGNLGILRSLIQRGADTREDDLGCALLRASRAGQEEAAMLLIAAGANVNLSCSPGSGYGLALNGALKARMGGLVRALLNADADPSKPSTLPIAIKWGDHSIIKDLIFAGASVKDMRSSNEYEAPLMIAIEKNDRELIRLLLAEGADVNGALSRGRTALAEATANGDIHLIRLLLEEGADPADEKALLNAISQSSDLVHLILEAFAMRYRRGKRGYGSSVLAKAIQGNDVQLFEALLKVNADVAGFCHEIGIRKTPLALAIEKKDLPMIYRLLDRDINLNSIISTSYRSMYLNTGPPRLTALLVAICTKDPQLVQLLVNKGADVNFPATRGVKDTPLQMAASIGSLAVVQVLIKNGAAVNAEPAERGGGTALQFAAIEGFIGIAEELLKRGADVNARPAKLHGRTALEGAIEHGRIDMVRFLLNAHAEIKGPGHPQYDRAIKYATENGHRALVEMLESLPLLDQDVGTGFIISEHE